MAMNANLNDSITELVKSAGGEAPTTEMTSTPDTGKSKSKRPEKPGEDYKYDSKAGVWVPLTPEEKAKKDALIAKKTENTAIYNNLITRGQSKQLSEVKRALKKAMSERARIAAYVVNTESKYEIVAKKVKAENSYNLGVVNKAPSSIKAVVITIPAVLDSLKNRIDNNEESPEILKELETIAATKEETPAVKIIVKPWEEFAKFLQNECAGYLHEDNSIFVEYTAKNKKVYRNPADIESGDNMPSSGSYVYLKFTTSTNAARTYSIKHSVRAKILAPGNYIAMKRWVTEPMLASYTPDQAAFLIKAHLQRFTESHTNKKGETKPAVISSLTAEANKLVAIKGNAIEATSFFPAGGAFKDSAWINSAAARGVSHWYDKTLEGSPRSVAPSEIKLVTKQTKTTSTDKVRISAAAEALKLANASEGTYKFNATNFPLIVKALRGHEDDAFAAINKQLKESKKTRSTNKVKAGPKYKAYANSGEDMQNLTLDEIQQILCKQ